MTSDRFLERLVVEDQPVYVYYGVHACDAVAHGRDVQHVQEVHVAVRSPLHRFRRRSDGHLSSSSARIGYATGALRSESACRRTAYARPRLWTVMLQDGPIGFWPLLEAGASDSRLPRVPARIETIIGKAAIIERDVGGESQGAAHHDRVLEQRGVDWCSVPDVHDAGVDS
jgi:hypothetical protein